MRSFLFVIAMLYSFMSEFSYSQVNCDKKNQVAAIQSCQLQFFVDQCDVLKKSFSDENEKEKIRNCKNEYQNRTFFELVRGCAQYFPERFNELENGLKNYWNGVSDRLKDKKNFLDQCDSECKVVGVPSCKRNIVKSIPSYQNVSDQELCQIKTVILLNDFQKFENQLRSLQRANQNFSRRSLTEESPFERNFNRDNLIDSAKEDILVQAAKSILEQQSQKFNCFKFKNQTEMICSTLFDTVLDPTKGALKTVGMIGAVAGTSVKAISAAKSVEKVVDKATDVAGTTVKAAQATSKVTKIKEVTKASPELQKGFSEVYRHMYASDRCYLNAWQGIYHLATEHGVDMRGAKVLYLLPPENLKGKEGLISALNNRKGQPEKWQFHVVIEKDGRILDPDFGTSAELPSTKEYFEKMFGKNSENMYVREVPAMEYLTNYQKVSKDGTLKDSSYFQLRTDEYSTKKADDFLKDY